MSAAFQGWAMVELMGHRVRYAQVSEVTLFGAPMARLDIPTEPPTVQFYGGSAIFCVTPTTEEVCRERCKPYLTARALPAHVEVDEYDGPDEEPDEDALCGHCDQSIGDEATERVTVDAGPDGEGGDVEVWHARCAARAF
jgi:hypothetical protein